MSLYLSNQLSNILKRYLYSDIHTKLSPLFPTHFAGDLQDLFCVVRTEAFAYFNGNLGSTGKRHTYDLILDGVAL